MRNDVIERETASPHTTGRDTVERIDIPESDAERSWLATQDFSNTAEDAYTGA